MQRKETFWFQDKVPIIQTTFQIYIDCTWNCVDDDDLDDNNHPQHDNVKNNENVMDGTEANNDVIEIIHLQRIPSTTEAMKKEYKINYDRSQQQQTIECHIEING
jgi:hypothetical protein